MRPGIRPDVHIHDAHVRVYDAHARVYDAHASPMHVLREILCKWIDQKSDQSTRN